MAKYMNETIVVEAMQWTADNHMELAIFMNVFAMESAGDDVYVPTLEGTIKATKGDWIIKEENGELSVCDSDTFDSRYKLI